MPRLSVFKNRDHLFNFYVEEDVILIGRSEAVQVPLAGDAVSRQHVRIRRHGATFTAENISNGNAMFVNGRYADMHVLKDGDRIEVPQHLIVFHRTDDEVADEKKDRSQHAQYRRSRAEIDQIFDPKANAVEKVSQQVGGHDFQGTEMLRPEDLANLQQSVTEARKAHVAFMREGQKAQVLLGMMPVSIGWTPTCQVRLPGRSVLSQVAARISPARGWQVRLAGGRSMARGEAQLSQTRVRQALRAQQRGPD